MSNITNSHGLPAAAAIPPEPPPVKATKKFWAILSLAGTLFLLVGLLPAIYMVRPSDVPSLTEMEHFSGVAHFVDSGTPRGGVFMVITDSTGRTERFSCRVKSGTTHGCVHRDVQKQAKAAEVWWFWSSPFPGERYKYPAKIIVDGKVVADRDKTIDRIGNAVLSSWLVVLVLLIFFVVLIPILLAVERSKYAIRVR